MININDWKAVLLDPVGHSWSATHLCPSIKVTLQYWWSLLSGNYPSVSYSPVSIPLEFANLHIPDLYIAFWKDKGLEKLEGQYDGAHFKKN